ncbi:MAG: cytochrome P450 [Lautropia sp.]
MLSSDAMDMSFEVKDRLDGVPVVDVDPFDEAWLRTPYEYWEQLRNVGPVAWIPKYQCYVLCRYEQVKAAQADWRTFTTAHGAGLSDIRKPENWRPASVIVEVEPPRHTEVRKVVNGVISPKAVRGWRARFESDAEAMIAPLIERRTFDGVRDVAESYVLKVFPDSMGLEINREQAVAVGDLNFNSIGPKNERVVASHKHVEPFLEWWHSAVRGEMLRAGGFGEEMFRQEAAGQIEQGLAGKLTMTFLRGGMDTTISSIGNALWLFASNPDQWQLLRSRPELLRGAFDEALRIESPISTNFRTTTTQVEIDGCRLAADKKVHLMLGAANRDPRRWVHPHRFDITRDAAGHVSFGTGIHACAGQLIARLEFDCVMKALMKRVKSIGLAGKAEHRVNNALRTLDHLPLEVTLDD